MVDRLSFALGLVGAGIGASLTPAMQEREGRAAGLSLTYRIIDAEVEGFGVDDLGEVIGWARRLGMDGLNITHQFKQAVIPLLDVRSRGAEAALFSVPQREADRSLGLDAGGVEDARELHDDRGT